MRPSLGGRSFSSDITPHPKMSFRTKQADFFFCFRSCESVGLRREKSLFLPAFLARSPRHPLLSRSAAAICAEFILDLLPVQDNPESES
jgi:hypothetical protein